MAMYCPLGVSDMGKTVIRNASQSGKVEAQPICIAELQTSRLVSADLICSWSVIADMIGERGSR